MHLLLQAAVASSRSPNPWLTQSQKEITETIRQHNFERLPWNCSINGTLRFMLANVKPANADYCTKSKHKSTTNTTHTLYSTTNNKAKQQPTRKQQATMGIDKTNTQYTKATAQSNKQTNADKQTNKQNKLNELTA